MTEPRQLATVNRKGNRMSTFKLVPLSVIHPHVAAQPRTAVDIDKVAEYVDDIARGDTFPPMVVFQDGETYWLADGFHRFYAAKTANLEAFECDVRNGALRDAVLFSCGANASHGLRRTTQDKRRAVAKLLDDEEWVKWSDKEIARRCAVSDKFVAMVRKDHARFVTANVRGDGATNRKYTTKHGTEAIMRLAQRPEPSRELPPGAIADYIREIEKRIDGLPAPKEAAEKFPADRWAFFPITKLEEMAEWMAQFAAVARQMIVDETHEHRRA